MKKKIKGMLAIGILAVAGVAVSFSSSYYTKVDAEVQHERFEKAVEIIKKYESLHSPKHWPFVGYGHKVLPGEKFSRKKALSEAEAEALLRKDLLKNCAVFREFGADSLILAVLAYNIGPGNVKKSTVVKKLKNGDREIEINYLAHCRYQGKQLPQLKRRRTEELATIFITEDLLIHEEHENNISHDTIVTSEHSHKINEEIHHDE